MKVTLTKDYRVLLTAGTVIEVNDNYAATLKALGVAEIVLAESKPKQTRKKAVEPEK